MLNKIVKTIAKQGLQKIKKESVKEVFDPQERIELAAFGITPLNVGEDEFIKCYTSKPGKNISYCKTRANAIRKKYHKTGVYK